MSDDANKRFWDRVAWLYAPFQERSSRKMYAALCQLIADELDAGGSVLELACGSGQLTARLSERFAHWEATDFSDKMVAQARKRIVSSTTTFAVQDATRLTYPDRSWDTVIAANMLHVMPDPDAAMAEITRVLKPGGMFAAVTFVRDESSKPLRMKLLETLGFRTYSAWTAEGFERYAADHGFAVEKAVCLPANGLLECVLFCRKR